MIFAIKWKYFGFIFEYRRRVCPRLGIWVCPLEIGFVKIVSQQKCVFYKSNHCNNSASGHAIFKIHMPTPSISLIVDDWHKNFKDWMLRR
jgi:hypothetical protein